MLQPNTIVFFGVFLPFLHVNRPMLQVKGSPVVILMGCMNSVCCTVKTTGCLLLKNKSGLRDIREKSTNRMSASFEPCPLSPAVNSAPNGNAVE